MLNPNSLVMVFIKNRNLTMLKIFYTHDGWNFRVLHLHCFIYFRPIHSTSLINSKKLILVTGKNSKPEINVLQRIVKSDSIEQQSQ